MKFSIKDFFGKCDQTRSFLQIWSHLLKKFLTENFSFCAVKKTEKTLSHSLKSNDSRLPDSTGIPQVLDKLFLVSFFQ